MYVVEIKNLYFSYDDSFLVLDNVSLNIKKGEFVGLIGPNGAGKTTLFKLILGLLKPLSGLIKLFGTDIRNFKDWKRIGYVPQKLNSDYFFPATVGELLNLTKGTRKEEIIALFHLDSLLEKQFLKLSGGQQQIVLLGLALSTDPDLLLLDEPTAGLDVHFRNHIIHTLKNFTVKEGKSVIMISHDIGFILNTVDRVLCLNRSLQYQGNSRDAIGVIENMFGIREVKSGIS